MNSSTSNSRNYRGASFAWIFAFAVLLIVSSVMAYSYGLAPLSGDLTRLGGFSEVHYGPMLPQRAFARQMYAYGDTSAARAGRHYDLIIFGDSFSVPHTDRATWVDYLAAESGLRTLVVPGHGTQSLFDYLSSRSFRVNPPHLIIYESVTRDLAASLGGMDGRKCEPPPARLALVLPRRPTGLEPTRLVQRPLDFISLGDRFGTAAFTLKQRLTNTLLPPLAGARRLHLSRDDLFSARLPNALLYLPRDKAAQSITPAASALLVCTLSALARDVERSGQTRFLFVPALDKSAAYAAFEPPRSFHMPPALEQLRQSGLKHSADPSPALEAAINRGERDIYLPNDTHWGSAGAAIAARAILHAIYD